MPGKSPTILIGGIPGVGKSSISGYIASNTGIDIVLSGDYLREFIRPFSDFDSFNVLKSSVYESWSMFGEKTRENIERGFLSQAEVINRGVSAILRRSLDNGEPLIVESLYFVPSQLDSEILDEILPVYLFISDRTVHEKRLNERQEFTHFKSPGQRLSRQLDVYRVMMDYSLRECKKFNVATFDNIDYLNTRERILKHIKEKMG